MFINFTNHISTEWSTAQMAAARAYGEIIDIPFPAVLSDASANDINAIADEYVDRIMQTNPKAVMCQGEFTLTFAVFSKLKSRGITVVAACSERKKVEHVENGATHKTIVFEFKQFREYCS